MKFEESFDFTFIKPSISFGKVVVNHPVSTEINYSRDKTTNNGYDVYMFARPVNNDQSSEMRTLKR